MLRINSKLVVIAAILLPLLVLAVFFTAYLFQSHRQAALQRLAAGIQPRADLSAAVTQLLADPPLNHAHFQDYDDWVTRAKASPSFAYGDDRLGNVRDGWPPADGLKTHLAESAPLLAGFHDLLANGLRPWLPDSIHIFLTWEWDRTYMPAQAAENWRLMVATGNAPTAPLDDLDLLTNALSPADSLNAFTAACRVADIRDRAYLDAVLAGTLTDARRQAWITEPDHLAADLLLALEMERRIQVPARALALGAQTAKGYWINHNQFLVNPDIQHVASDWWNQVPTLATDLARLAVAEDRFDPATSASAPAWTDRAPGDLDCPTGLHSAAETALEAATTHRLALLAAHILALQTSAGALPDDSANTTLASDLSGGHDRRPLRYLPLSPTRFAIYDDPTGTRPEYDAAPPVANQDLLHNRPPATGAVARWWVIGGIVVERSHPTGTSP